MKVGFQTLPLSRVSQSSEVYSSEYVLSRDVIKRSHLFEMLALTYSEDTYLLTYLLHGAESFLSS